MSSGRHQNWPVPYCRPLEGDWNPGQSVFVEGFIIGENRIDVNLSSGKDDGVDIPLHISCRLKEGKIVLNSLQDGKWGKEERHGCPFKRGEEFDLRIRAHDQEFEIFAGGKELGRFAFRQALNRVTHTQVVGDIELHRVSWEGKYYPVPFQTSLPGGFGPGKSLCLAAKTEEKANRFAINLLCRNGDVAFHFNVRFDEKKVVRNSQTGGSWMKVEERDGEFPFQKGHLFDLIIQSKADGYHVFLDGHPFITYQHRVDVNEVSGVLIEGDLELQGVQW